MMPAGHHSYSDSTLLPLPKSAITWFGGIFARLPPLAAGLSTMPQRRIRSSWWPIQFRCGCCSFVTSDGRNGANIPLSCHSWLSKIYPIFVYIVVTVKWRTFSSPGRRFSAMPKWRSLRTNDGGLTWLYCMHNRMAEVGNLWIWRQSWVFPFNQTPMPKSKSATGNTEQFIELVREHPNLYNPRLPEV